MLLKHSHRIEPFQLCIYLCYGMTLGIQVWHWNTVFSTIPRKYFCSCRTSGNHSGLINWNCLNNFHRFLALNLKIALLLTKLKKETCFCLCSNSTKQDFKPRILNPLGSHMGVSHWMFTDGKPDTRFHQLLGLQEGFGSQSPNIIYFMVGNFVLSDSSSLAQHSGHQAHPTQTFTGSLQ